MVSAYESDPATEPLRIHAYSKTQGQGQQPSRSIEPHGDGQPASPRRTREARLAAGRDARVRYADFFDQDDRAADEREGGARA